jgi:transcriptional regulator with XRE-family HTH domain
VDWSEILKNRREACGLTQAQLAKAVGASVNSVASWESARRRPSRTMLGKLATFLGMDDEEEEAVYRSTGHEPGAGSRYADLARMARPVAWLAGEIADHPWPTLITNERYEIVGWNQAANVVAELDFVGLDGPQERHLMHMAVTDHFSKKLTNWDHVMGTLIGFYKKDQITLGSAVADPYFGALIDYIAKNHAEFIPRLFALWESAPAYEEGARNQVEIEWRTSDGTKLRFMAIFETGSDFDAAWIFDWHPLDGTTWDWLNAHRESGPVGGDHISIATSAAGWRGILRHVREAAGLTRPEVAARTDHRVSASTVEAYERGTRLPSREKLVALAEALGLDGVQTNAMLAGAGMEPEPSDFARFMMGEPLRFRRVPVAPITPRPLDFLREEAETQPFLALQIDRNADIAAANAPMRRLLGIESSTLLTDGVERNLVYVFATGKPASHLVNWDDIVAALAPIGAEPYNAIAPWKPPTGPLARAIEAVRSQPDAFTRLQQALRKNPFHGRAGVHCLVEWREGASLLQFDCVVATPSPQGWTWRVDWHPADAATWAWVNAG